MAEQLDSGLMRRLAVLLVRHGETAWNAEARLQGQTDVPLSAVGREQARKLGVRLRRAWQPGGNPEHRVCPPPSLVFSSDLSRARETAQILLETALGSEDSPVLPVQTMSELRERSFGKFEGLTADEAAVRYPGESHHNEGETYAEVSVRMIRALEHVWETAFAAPGTEALSQTLPVVLIVGHGGSLRTLISHAIGTRLEGRHAFALGNTSLTLLEYEGSQLATAKGRLRLLNDTAHLE